MALRRMYLPVAIFFTICLSAPALADDDKAPQKTWKKFNVNLGGSLLTARSDVRIGVEYNPFKHVGFGLAAESFNLRVEAEKGTEVPGVDFNGVFNLEQVGLNGYVSFFF